MTTGSQTIGTRPKARIYQPAKTAMQSGRANTHRWVLEFEPAHPRTLDPLMGWTSSQDTETQLRLKFDSREEAETYASARSIPYILVAPRGRRPVIKAYADNFRYTPPEA
jgi:hypothetical protein